MTDALIRVYWQPGCTSCLAAKQLLARHGIAFESINVRSHPGAMATLAALGARSVPVVARAERWIYAQDLTELATFLGLTRPPAGLDACQLVSRIDALLTAAVSFVLQLPASICEQAIAGRDDRTIIDIPFHIAQIAAGFLDAVQGGELNYAHFERRPQGVGRRTENVAQELRHVHQRFSAWAETGCAADGIAANNSPLLRTYYGTKPLAAVLERSAWHIAQHARQLEHLLVGNGLQPTSQLGDRELAGLPLPDGVWDAE